MIDRRHIQDKMVELAKYDVLEFPDIAGHIRVENPELSKEEVRQETLAFIQDMLEHGVLCAGEIEFIAPNTTRLRRWNKSTESVMTYIRDEWQRIGDKSLEPWDICQFDRPKDSLPPLE